MNITKKPVKATVLFGLACGSFFVPAIMLFDGMVSWSTAFCLIVWVYLVMYGALLARWAGKGIASIIFPLLIPFSIMLQGNPEMTFIMVCLIVLSWIRSGISFTGSLYRRLGIEVLLCAGGGTLVAFFVSDSPMSLALGIWMFFLIQAIYFILIGDKIIAEAGEPVDPFEKARREVEEILASEDILGL